MRSAGVLKIQRFISGDKTVLPQSLLVVCRASPAACGCAQAGKSRPSQAKTKGDEGNCIHAKGVEIPSSPFGLRRGLREAGLPRRRLGEGGNRKCGPTV